MTTAPEAPETRTKAHVDYCPCSKPPGVWGEGGWHWRDMDETLLASLEIEWVREHVHREPTSDERRACTARAKSNIADYRDTPYGIERCPAWAARLQMGASS